MLILDDRRLSLFFIYSRRLELALVFETFTITFITIIWQQDSYFWSLGNAAAI